MALKYVGGYGVLYVSASTAVFLSLMRGSRRRRWHAFVGFHLVVMVAVQYHALYLAQVVSYPNQYSTELWSFKTSRLDCPLSSKGGKRGSGDTSLRARNPCFCHDFAYCVSGTHPFAEENELPESKRKKWSAILANPDMYRNTRQCDDETVCFERTTGKKIDLYVPANRDCDKGQGAQCSRLNPCTPCELSHALPFLAAQGEWSRCGTCTPANRGDCGFVSGVGPYCLEEPGRGTGLGSEPCRRCCTEPYLPEPRGQRLYDEDGQCV